MGHNALFQHMYLFFIKIILALLEIFRKNQAKIPIFSCTVIFYIAYSKKYRGSYLSCFHSLAMADVDEYLNPHWLLNIRHCLKCH